MNNKLTDKAKEYLKEQLAYWPSSQRGDFHTWVKWAITDPGMLHAQGLYTQEQISLLLRALKRAFQAYHTGGDSLADAIKEVERAIPQEPAAASPSIHVKKEEEL